MTRPILLLPAILLAAYLLHPIVPHDDLHAIAEARHRDGHKRRTPTPTPRTEVEPSRTPTPRPNDDRTPTPTAIPPTATPLPTATAVPAAMHEGVPVCATHDPTRWHALVERNSDNSIRCTYTHEHHDDPNAVNAIFGQPGDWFGSPGQSISYPWQTGAAPALENVAKHEGYKWHVRENIRCVNANQAQFNGCITAYRALVHSLGTASDSVVRFHSFSVEMQVDYFGQVGIVRGGGHMDTGHLALEFADGVTECPGVPSDDAFSTCIESPKRHHTGANHPNHTDLDLGGRNWYVAHALLQAGPQIEPFAPDNWPDPFVQLPQRNPVHNNSRGRLENIGFMGRGALMKRYGAPGTRVSVSITVDRAGGEEFACGAFAPDCIPFRADTVVANYFHQAGQAGVTSREYDVLSPVTNRSLIRFPN